MRLGLRVFRSVVILMCIVVVRIFFYCDGHWPSEMVTTRESFKTELALSFKSPSLPVGKETWPFALNLAACHGTVK